MEGGGPSLILTPLSFMFGWYSFVKAPVQLLALFMAAPGDAVGKKITQNRLLIAL